MRAILANPRNFGGRYADFFIVSWHARSSCLPVYRIFAYTGSSVASRRDKILNPRAPVNLALLKRKITQPAVSSPDQKNNGQILTE
jgi:hypothetical protein